MTFENKSYTSKKEKKIQADLGHGNTRGMENNSQHTMNKDNKNTHTKPTFLLYLIPLPLPWYPADKKHFFSSMNSGRIKSEFIAKQVTRLPLTILSWHICYQLYLWQRPPFKRAWNFLKFLDERHHCTLYIHWTLSASRRATMQFHHKGWISQLTKSLFCTENYKCL